MKHCSPMMNAKKKALMTLIKKMRGMEIAGLGDEEQELHGNMEEGEGSGDEVVELDSDMPEEESEEIAEEDNDWRDDMRSFMKKSSKIDPGKRKSKGMMMSVVSVKPSAKMKKLG